MSHLRKAMAFLKSRGYNEKISKGMLDSLKRAGISDSGLNGALMSLGGTGSVRRTNENFRKATKRNIFEKHRLTVRMDWYLLV